ESASIGTPDVGQQSTATQPGADLRPSAPDPNAGNTRPKRAKRSAFFTSTPETPAPRLLCPVCDVPLVFRHTVLSGVKPIERWDYFDCRTCGPFVYRDRTRKLRPAF